MFTVGLVWLMKWKKFGGKNCMCLVVTVETLGARDRAIGGTHGRLAQRNDCLRAKVCQTHEIFFAKHMQKFACNFFQMLTKQGLCN